MKRRWTILFLLGALATLGGCEFGVGMEDGAWDDPSAAGLTAEDGLPGSTDGAVAPATAYREVRRTERLVSRPAQLRDDSREAPATPPAMPVLNPLLYPGERGHGDPQPWAPDSTGHLDI